MGRTSDDDILEATGDCAVALLVEGRFIAGLQPHCSIGVRY